MKAMETRYATLREVSERYQVKLSWLYEQSRQDSLPGQLRFGRQIRVNLQKFEEGAEA
jgi:predicted DNA-binding transcriptional regulator AlpA